MENIFLHLLNMSLTAGILVVAVVLLRGLFHKAPRWLHCLLWALVAVRLVCPFAIESNLSLMPKAAVSVPTPDTAPVEQVTPDTPDAPSTEVIVPDTPIPDLPIVDAPVVTPPVVDTPVVDTPVVTPPVVNHTPVEPPSADAAVSTATPEASADPWQIVLTVATYVWLAGVAAMAVYAVVTTLRLRRRVGEAAHLEGNLWQCDHIRSPFILGVFRPRVYLPSDLNGMARDSVVAHEQAHLHRRDHWWKPLGFLLLTVYWFNPLMWVAYILLCRDIEAACDERVVRDMNAEARRSYSEALLACSAPRRLVSACPLAFGETSVKSRIKSVLSYKKPTIWIIVAALLVSTVAGVCLLTDPKPDDSDTDKQSSATDEDETPDDSIAASAVGETIVVEAYSWMGEEELRNLFGYLPESNPALSSTYGALPVKVLYSRAELDAVLRSLQDDRWKKMDFSAFDEAFFEENHLVMTYYKAGTSSAQPAVGSYVYTEDGTCLSVRLDVYQPYAGDTMLGQWLLFSGIQKADMTGVTKKEAYVWHIIPTDHFIAVFDEPREQPTTTMEQWKEREFLSDEQAAALHTLLRRLADENAWQKADSVDRAFAFVGCVNVGAADYYVPSDFSALLSEDGMLGWLTAQEAALISEWFPNTSENVTPPSGDLTDINAQVTGTVLSWNKEEEYVLLEVNPQYSEELGETLKVYTGYAPAGCAPEVGNALRVLYTGYVQEGFPNAIYAASLWNATTYSILETGVDLYDDLLKKIVDYCYGLAPSAEAPDCSYLIFREHLDPMFAIGIKVMDLDKNGQNDLLISAYNGFYGTRNYVYDAYTIQNGKLVHLLSSGERSQYYLHQDGYIEHQWSGGAALSGTDFYRLTDGALVFVERVTYDGYYAVEIGLVDSLASITDTDGFWFHTTQVPGDSNEGYEHITAQQAEDILAAFTAAHPPLNINFLQLEKGGSGSSTADPMEAYWRTLSHPMPYDQAAKLTGGYAMSQERREYLQQVLDEVTWGYGMLDDVEYLSNAFFSLDGKTRYFVYDDFLYKENAPDDRACAALTEEQSAIVLENLLSGGVVERGAYTLCGYFAEWNKEAQFFELDVVQADDASLIGKRIWVSTRHLLGRGIPYIGSLLEVSYDGFVRPWYQQTVYAIDYQVMDTDEVINVTVPESDVVNGKVIYVVDGAALMYFDDLEPYDTVLWVNHESIHPDGNLQIGETYQVSYDGLIKTTYPVQLVAKTIKKIDSPAISSDFISEEDAIALAGDYWGIPQGSKDMETAYVAVIYVLVAPTEDVPDYVIGLRYVDALHDDTANSALFRSVHVDAKTGEIRDLLID